MAHFSSLVDNHEGLSVTQNSGQGIRIGFARAHKYRKERRRRRRRRRKSLKYKKKKKKKKLKTGKSPRSPGGGLPPPEAEL